MYNNTLLGLRHLAEFSVHLLLITTISGASEVFDGFLNSSSRQHIEVMITLER